MEEDIWEEDELNDEEVIIENEDDVALNQEDEEEEDNSWFYDLMMEPEEEDENISKMKQDDYLAAWIPSSPTPKNNIPSNAKYAYNYLNNKGLPSHVSAGIVGNLMKESNVNPNTRDGDKRGGIGGIAQWDPSRSKNLIAYSKSTGRSPVDLDTQLDFVIHEAQQRGDLDSALKTKSPEEAALVFGRRYERPNERYADWGTRQSNARGLVRYQYGGTNNIPDDLKDISDESIAEYLYDEGVDLEDPSNNIASGIPEVINKIDSGIDTVRNVKSRADQVSNTIAKYVSLGIDAQTEIAGVQRNNNNIREYNARKNKKRFANVNTNLNQPLIYT